MRIALVSLDQKWLDKDANFVQCEPYTRQAAEAECRLIVFPEMTLTGFAPEVKEIVESVDDSATLNRFAELARSHSIYIVFGACLRDDRAAKPYNTLCVATPDGECELLYRKVHLFTYAGEEHYLSAGDQLSTLAIDGVSFGLSICYDLRFPELFSAMTARSDVLLLIANWPSKRGSHWHALLRARAIENQSVMIGVNRIGTDGNGLEYVKSSVIISPEGEPIEAADYRQEMDIYEVDLKESHSYRRNFPTVRDKRYALYREMFDQS